MKDIKVGDYVLTYNGEFKKVLNKMYNGNRSITKITTNLNSVYSTNNHKWLVLEDISGSIKEKYAEDLEVGDVLVLNCRDNSGFYQDFPKYTDLEMPKLDTDLAWFLGYFLGNGSVSSRIRKDNGHEDNKFRIACPSNYPTIIEKVKKQFARIVGDKYSFHNKGTSVEIATSKKAFTEYFSNIKQVDTDIHIPDFIMQNTSEIQLAFLAGILDSDGSVRNDTKDGKGYGQITLNSSKYKGFIEEIQSLYNYNGIITKVQIKKRKDKSDEHILKTVSFIYRKKCYEKLLPYSEKLKEDYILEDISKEKNGIIFPDSLALQGEKVKVWNKNKNISLDKALKFYPDIDYVPAVITEIEENYEDCDVYDIEVADNHNFYINGTLTHNSAVSILFDPDDELMFNSKVGNWWYENPQRGRYNASAVLERGETSLETYKKLFKSTKEYGEPGFVWRSDKREGFNP